ncbi:phenolic acid decarboxylase [Streptomyces halobius]|uniref:Phenolic acid decarboxylase n=1 Tax=Streptomyces halobius TaxID=2879846 RepID=A0ABY4MH55_9ACTN|nr:phenolic acid decarboxylase [Streptomyces halobius]UQA97134.1 phenolic acid decarboxylase [Streptomyces halobius]
MTDNAAPAAVGAPTQDLTAVVGYHFIYTYANGWRYEIYVKNNHTLDYRIHSGLVGGRWVKDQQMSLVRLEEDQFKMFWTEPTGTSVAVNIMPARRLLHGVIFFPQWIQQHGERTALYQNKHLDQMRRYRDQGPTYPISVVAEFAKITFAEYVGMDDETVIAVAPADLPPGRLDRTN